MKKDIKDIVRQVVVGLLIMAAFFGAAGIAFWDGYDEGYVDGVLDTVARRDAIYECWIQENPEYWGPGRNATTSHTFIVREYPKDTPDWAIPDKYDFNATWIDANGDGVGEANPFSNWCLLRGIDW